MIRTEKESLYLQNTMLREIKSVLGIVSHWMAMPLFLLFWLADYVYVPHLKSEFLFLRLLIIPICLISYNFVKKSKSYFSAQLITAFYMISLATVINIMIFMINDASTSYYAGLNLVAIAALSFIPLSKKFWAITFLGIYSPYIYFLGSKLNSLEQAKLPIAHMFFITGSIVICLIIRLFNEKLRANELKAKLELENELINREKVIVQKTNEATNLHKLSSQFSPQIVHAIRDGQISLDEGVKRAKICAIFIDIVKSTDKVTKLNELDVQISLERFLETTLTIFLKYDLTIDKFHGDGILAFSNMPVQREDFIERTCVAALRAVEAISEDRDFYLTHWKSPLEVRVGISVGFANVGFYGDQKYFKTFTAIGTPLPYASRLTSSAEPNQILIDEEIANYLEKFGYYVRNCGFKSLKGFEDDQKSVFELLATPSSAAKADKTKYCPTHPNSVLFLDTNEHGHFVFKCRECNYIDTGLSQNQLRKVA